MNRFVEMCLETEIDSVRRDCERGYTSRQISGQDRLDILRRFENVDSERLRDTIAGKYPDLISTAIRGIWSDGTVLFENRHGLTTENLTQLGYRYLAALDKYVSVALPNRDLPNWVLVNAAKEQE